MNEPAASPSDRGNECVRNRTFILSDVRGLIAILRDVLEPSPELGELGSLRGDELSNQSCREEHASDRQARLHEVDERTEADPTNDAPQNRDDSNDHPDDEQAGSQ